MKSAFIGHRRIFAKTLQQRITETIEAEIANGLPSFTTVTHGDRLALSNNRRLTEVETRD